MTKCSSYVLIHDDDTHAPRDATRISIGADDRRRRLRRRPCRLGNRRESESGELPRTLYI